MYVFNYDPTTLRFIGGTPAEFDQLEPGKLLCPAWASLTPIPPFDATVQWPFYVPDEADSQGGTWELRSIPTVRELAQQAEAAAASAIAADPADPQAKADAIVANIEQHLLAVQKLRDQLQAGE